MCWYCWPQWSSLSSRFLEKWSVTSTLELGHCLSDCATRTVFIQSYHMFLLILIQHALCREDLILIIKGTSLPLWQSSGFNRSCTVCCGRQYIVAHLLNLHMHRHGEAIYIHDQNQVTKRVNSTLYCHLTESTCLPMYTGHGVILPWLILVQNGKKPTFSGIDNVIKSHTSIGVPRVTACSPWYLTSHGLE